MKMKEEELLGHHVLSDKEKKNLLLLELIRKKGPISRQGLSKILDLNIVSVSNYIKDYIDKKIVLESGQDVSSGGRPPELIELNTKGNFVIGLDIDSRYVTANMTDIALNRIEKAKTLEEKTDDIEKIIIKAIDLIQTLMKKSKVGPGKIKAIGLGVSYINPISVKSAIEKSLDIEAFVEAAPACAGLGEKRLNLKADREIVLYIYSDIGCGIVIREDSYFGAGSSKESRYLEPWSVDLGIVQIARREVERGVGTNIVELAKGDVNNITEEVVIEAALGNDEVASGIIHTTGMNLGLRIAYLVNLFGPEAVVIGGGIEKAGELILGPIRKIVKRFALSERANTIDIIPSALGEDAVSLGAAALATREIFLRA